MTPLIAPGRAKVWAFANVSLGSCSLTSGTSLTWIFWPFETPLGLMRRSSWAPSGADAEIRLGLYGSLTGSEATFGKDTEAGDVASLRRFHSMG